MLCYVSILTPPNLGVNMPCSHVLNIHMNVQKRTSEVAFRNSKLNLEKILQNFIYNFRVIQ